ncbi:hypothetical protein TWF106_006818 [Orbilia oligospora]|uniref:Pectate lyase n=1 Tax=Orbilia oligospora TaxID=2813651 RepID=A0A6G1MBD3_ORBOL|nr:hypothetical protein TWF788_001989 [Orbilia oligospora]KAF3212004.1 hypothetical protein TWF679_006128 [Orbilia oligospora]KAF3220071.1 hypothetical protein TWF106_006818 [Orbilia oligospora]KAF3228174.1 hypothetical protein TWF191_003111 [Orbilia oligospora]KAF3252157.1 hypothetical protein TWF192_004610 [Orbilia oligospora]
MKQATFTILATAALVSAQAQPWAQCGGSGWTGPTSCVSGWSCVYSNEWYSQCIQSSGGTTASITTKTTTKAATTTKTTTKATTTTAGNGSGSGGTGLTTVVPASAGSTTLPSAKVISGVWDGGMLKYDRNPKVCADQKETGEADAMFILESGATIRNVIIGPDQAEGIHCRGPCTVENVWWLDVCEDAITIKQSSGNSYITGGGAFKASDKVAQFNGRGTLTIKNFYVNDYGKVVRSCGNCSGNGGPRNVVIDNIIAKSGGVLCGINTNYGDTCKISNSCQNSGKYCDRYTGNSSGAEPTKIGSGPDGTYCTTTNVRTSC